jgi:SAM-dependent MidA family methyltransferase
LDLSPRALPDLDLDDGLGEESDNLALRSLIEYEIRHEGPIPFRRFMELALYHPVEGYYCSNRQPVGRSGDYVTSPEISPIFGYAVARQITQFCNLLGTPDNFRIVEYGAGNGRMAQDVLRWIAQREPALSRSMSYAIVEKSPALRHLLFERFQPEVESRRMEISADISPGTYHCLLANELLDSFPVHRVQINNGQLSEIFVDYRDDQFIEVLGEPSTPELAEYFSRLGLQPADGSIAEVNLDVQDWLIEAAKQIESGFMLLFDYGYPASRLFARWRSDGTLLCFHRHSVTSNPYQFIGRQDITCHVDFTTLETQARKLGFQLLGTANQSGFLSNLGVYNDARPPAGNEVPSYLTRRRAIESLMDPAGLGRVGVLLFGRGVPAFEPLGFANNPPAHMTSSSKRGANQNG